MKKQQSPAANPTESKQGDKKQTKSTEKTQDDSKNKNQQSESNPYGNKTKKPAAEATPSNKTYFTAGAQGDSEHSYRTLDTLISLFEQAIRKAFPEDQTLPVLVVPARQTDYQCNSAMPIAKVRKIIRIQKRY